MTGFIITSALVALIPAVIGFYFFVKVNSVFRWHFVDWLVLIGIFLVGWIVQLFQAWVWFT